MAFDKKKFLRKLGVHNRGKPPKVFNFYIINNKKVLCIVPAPSADEALRLFWLGGHKYSGKITATNKPPEEYKKIEKTKKRKGEKK